MALVLRLATSTTRSSRRSISTTQRIQPPISSLSASVWGQKSRERVGGGKWGSSVLLVSQPSRHRRHLSSAFFQSVDIRKPTTVCPMLLSTFKNKNPTTTSTTKIIATTTTQRRHFSAKNRQRKEAKREQKRLSKEQEPQKLSQPKRKEEKEGAVQQQPQQPAKIVSTTTAAADRSDMPIVTQTKAASSAKEEEDSSSSDDTSTMGTTTWIAAAPEGDEDGEEPFVSQFEMPDRDKEKELLAAQQHIASLYQQGQYQKGLEAAQQALELTSDHFSAHHPATASAHVNVGLGHKHLGQFASALAQYKTALDVYKDTVGDDHASYALVQHNLGLLYQSQIHFDASVKQQQDRLRLMELAMACLQDALRIRKAELPPEHPHIVATQSAMGALLTAHLLHQHKKVVAAGGASKARYVPVMKLKQDAWKAASDHLTQALQTALQHPRGESSLKRTDKHHYLNIQKKQQLLQKKQSKQQQQSMPSSESQEEPSQQSLLFAPMQTKSAAAAAQNLAVFYKAKATTLDSNDEKQVVEYNDWMHQARDLYVDALAVRKALLPKGHEDIYITQYSLAELHDSMGEEDAAQALRQEILDTWGSTSTFDGDNTNSTQDDVDADDGSHESEDTGGSIGGGGVVVEKTQNK